MGIFDSIRKLIGGDTAHDAADSGNPVKIGGKAITVGSAPSAVANGDRANAWFDTYGRLVVVIENTSGTEPNIGTPTADGRAVGQHLYTMPYNHVFNGTSWDRLRLDADDAAPGATSAVFVSGGRYQATVDEVDDGDVGRLRMTARRGLISAGDGYLQASAYSDMPADADEHLVEVPLAGARGVGFYINNTLDVNVTIKIYLYNGVPGSIIYEETIGAVVRVLAPGTAGDGADARYISIPALAFPVFGPMAISYECASAPASGTLRIDVGRLS